SASIVYTSGSTKFGDTSDDIHQFSGSLRVTGSGDHYFTDGNVGIGTTAPANTLHVQKDVDDYIAKFENDGNSTSSNGLWVDTRWNTATNTVFRVTSNSGTADFFYIKGDGNVGIGNTAPSQLLTVAGNISGSGNLDIDGNMTASGDAYFGSNVGIGTTSPTHVLDIYAGSDNATGGIKLTNDDTGTG
ncbi:MAG: hypothetical protein QF541_25455, partial [Lentisphaeria bacterium]|nr:hypothetical protein [Lentisphaeria bacterium]